MNPIRIELPTEFAVGPVNAYLFTEPEPILVDTGVKSEASWAALVAGMAAQGVQVADLRRVVITHPHVDHCGQATRLAAASGATVWVSELGADWLLDFAGMWQKRLVYYRDVFLPQTGLPPAMQDGVVAYFEGVKDTFESVPAAWVRPFGLQETLVMGGLEWQVVYAPGHANHQTCFYQPETRQFLAADHLLHRAPTPIVERPLTGHTRIPALPQFLQSLDLAEALDIDIVYPGHGDLITDHRALIRKQRQRIHQRKMECWQLVADGHETMADLVNIMYAHYPPQARFSGLWMLVGYLDLLKAEGLVVERPIGEVLHFIRKETGD
ncbi:MAG: MBL fold metallo-hydrolase [Ardenticatenaceae bacterium]|nr:MBL fold metallo-hydrolase [Ardenticatenaceae bacterium]